MNGQSICFCDYLPFQVFEFTNSSEVAAGNRFGQQLVYNIQYLKRSGLCDLSINNIFKKRFPGEIYLSAGFFKR